MSTLALILRELIHRCGNFLLSALVLIGAVALFTGFLTTSTAAKNETRRVTRDMGWNLRIIPQETDMERFYTTGYSEATMPEAFLDRLASYENVFLTYNHLSATLQRRHAIERDGRTAHVLLTGVAPTVAAAGKKPMGFSIEAGTLHVGFQAALDLGVSKGDELTLNGRLFKVVRTAIETGSEDDIRVFGLLSDVQGILGLEGRINEIRAIDCLPCLTTEDEPLKILRAELEKVLPEARILLKSAIADARARQRRMADQYFGFLTPFILVVAAVWVGVLNALNVRERRHEIGVMRALGHSSGRIAALFLGRAVALGIAGAILGFALGTVLALTIGPSIFQITARLIQPDWNLLGWALLITPGFAAVAGFIPAMMAVAQDPAVTLREE